MKKVASYIFLLWLACTYVATNMGFGVHTCNMDGSSRIILLAGESPCSHGHRHNADHHNDCCQTDHDRNVCGNGHDNKCCHTLVYILDQAQNIMDDIKVEAPEALDVASLSASGRLAVYYGAAVSAFQADDIVCGPGGGVATFAPLRL